MKASVLASIVAALVIGGAVGFITGKNTASTPEDKTEVFDEPRSARRAGPLSSSSSSVTSSRGPRVNSAADAMALPGQNNRLRSLMDYYAGLAPSSFEEEADKLEDLPWSERIMVGYLLFARWGEEDPTAAMEYTKSMGFAGMFVKRTVMQSWASKFPQDAASYYTANPQEFRMGGMMAGRGRHGGGSAASVIAMEWAREDSAGAMAWAQSLEGSDQRDAMRGIFQHAAKEDPAKAAEMLVSIGDEEARLSAQNTLAREWGSKDWDEARAWIASLPADQQADATARSLRGMADTDPVAAAAEIGILPEGDERDDAVEAIARKWGRDDPASAAAWVMQTGDEHAQAESIGGVISSWVGEDPVAALEFVNQQSEGAVRDRAASSYVISNQSGDIQQNLRLAESIGDEGMRRRAIGITATGWWRQDKEAAANYIDTTNALNDKGRERIRKFAEAGGHRSSTR